jgi:hypothetical protein
MQSTKGDAVADDRRPAVLVPPNVSGFDRERRISETAIEPTNGALPPISVQNLASEARIPLNRRSERLIWQPNSSPKAVVEADRKRTVEDSLRSKLDERGVRAELLEYFFRETSGDVLAQQDRDGSVGVALPGPQILRLNNPQSVSA